MKFLHTADWHIGKKLHGISLLEEQDEVFRQLLETAIKEKVDAIVIAGDLYDRSVPPAEAVKLLNKMLYKINVEQSFPILAVSGNHDSSTRLQTGGPWYQEKLFYLYTTLSDQVIKGIKIDNSQFFLLPYFEPIDARLYFKDETLKTHQDAVKRVVEEMKKNFDPSLNQVLVSHFFVAGSLRTDSEVEATAGGLDSIAASLFKDFQYVALGHLHNPNAFKSSSIQYSGSLLKYSVSEANQIKGFRLVELTDNGEVSNRFCSVEPLKNLTIIEESFPTITNHEYYQDIDNNDYIYVKLTDTKMIPNAMNRLREIYPNIIGMERINRPKLMSNSRLSRNKEEKLLSPTKMFENFYEVVTGDLMSENQQKIVTKMMEDIQKEEN